MADNVNSPAHYKDHCSIECIDALRLVLGEGGFEAFCKGNAIKYLWRHRFKHSNGVEDLKKAKWYVAKLFPSSDKDYLWDMINEAMDEYVTEDEEND